MDVLYCHNCGAPLALAAAALWFFVLRGGGAPEPPETGQQGGLVLTTPGAAPSVTIPPAPKPTPEPTPEPVALESTDAGFMDRAPCTRVFFSRAESSGMIVHNGTSYGPDRAIDGDPNTSRQENAPGYGLGETLTLCFEFSAPVSTEHLRFTILDVYPGAEWEDAAITDICAWA